MNERRVTRRRAFLGAVRQHERDIRFSEVKFPDRPALGSIKLTVKSCYVTIDIFDSTRNLDIEDEHLLEDIPRGCEEMAQYEDLRLERFIYMRDGENQCNFLNYYDHEEGRSEARPYNYDFIKLAVSDFMFLCDGQHLDYIFIDCNVDRVRDPLKRRQCIENRTEVFIEFKREVHNVRPEFRSVNLNLRVDNADELRTFLPYLRGDLPRINLMGLNSNPPAYDVIDFYFLRDEHHWALANFFRTTKLVCVGRAQDLWRFNEIDMEIRKLSMEDVESLTEHYSTRTEIVRIRIKCREDIDLRKIEGDGCNDNGEQPDDEHLDERGFYKLQVSEKNIARRVYQNCLGFYHPTETRE